ncbi:hypothetical protein BDV97DRAFT_345509 [Delphinella strobiligena]|nr:hypothetical protein BDV97DRAFT_345509 [Delphinella strobiligena]
MFFFFPLSDPIQAAQKDFFFRSLWRRHCIGRFVNAEACVVCAWVKSAGPRPRSLA